MNSMGKLHLRNIEKVNWAGCRGAYLKTQLLKKLM
jgi:hypothetical protein